MRQKVQALRAAVARYPKPPLVDAALKDVFSLMDEMAGRIEALEVYRDNARLAQRVERLESIEARTRGSIESVGRTLESMGGRIEQLRLVVMEHHRVHQVEEVGDAAR